jgi:CheY-like chemotaxis protein
MLSIILGYGELIMLELPPSDPLRDSISEICKAAARGAALTHQLLMFSRQQVLEPRILDLNEVLHNAHNMLKRIIGEDIELFCRTTPELGSIKADPGSLDQVIMNLAINARDAMPAGGKLTIETANVELDATYASQHVGVRPGSYVMLAVSDTGVGMSAQTQARMFEPFFTTKQVGKGTGLGLSTVHGIVEQSGGSIWATSAPGQGTTFKVYFPRAVDEANSPVAPSARANLRGAETILLIEDEEPVRAIASTILRRYGYGVLAAGNAVDALRLCSEHKGPIDLVLSDVVMPQMSGPELAQRLRLARPGLRFLFMSGYTDDSITRHGIVAEGVAFIHKPFLPESLAAKVREALAAPAR